MKSDENNVGDTEMKEEEAEAEAEEKSKIYINVCCIRWNICIVDDDDDGIGLGLKRGRSPDHDVLGPQPPPRKKKHYMTDEQVLQEISSLKGLLVDFVQSQQKQDENVSQLQSGAKTTEKKKKQTLVHDLNRAEVPSLLSKCFANQDLSVEFENYQVEEAARLSAEAKAAAAELDKKTKGIMEKYVVESNERVQQWEPAAQAVFGSTFPQFHVQWDQTEVSFELEQLLQRYCAKSDNALAEVQKLFPQMEALQYELFISK